jgi:hypothetical protein
MQNGCLSPFPTPSSTIRLCSTCAASCRLTLAPCRIPNQTPTRIPPAFPRFPHSYTQPMLQPHLEHVEGPNVGAGVDVDHAGGGAAEQGHHPGLLRRELRQRLLGGVGCGCGGWW